MSTLEEDKHPFTNSVAISTALLALFLVSTRISAAGTFREFEPIEEIVVTARKRDERLLDIPVAVTAYSADGIQRAGFQNIRDVTLLTTGVQFHQQSGTDPGRVNSSLRFRGLHVNSEIPTFQLGSLFIDGVYVLGSISSFGLEDAERVEVIKGPQAAYFGRNTFGGAINLITRKPGNERRTKVAGQTEEFGDYEINLGHEGPMIRDKLSYRLALRSAHEGSQYTAQDGGELGEETSWSVSGTLYGNPSDKSEYALRIYYGEDDDGPPAGVFISGTAFDTCSGTTGVDPDTGETVTRQRYICGSVPQPDELPGDFISYNTTLTGIDTLIAAGTPNLLRDVFLGNTSGDPSLDVGPSLGGPGVARDTLRIGLSGSVDIGGLTLASSLAFNQEESRFVRDFDLTPVGSFWAGEGRDYEDTNVELRVTSDPSKRYRWLLGVNRYHQEIQLGGTGGVAVTPCLLSFPPNPPLEDFPCIGSPFVGRNSLANTDEVTTLGWFGGLELDVTERLSLTLEGRLQRDEVTKGQFNEFEIDNEDTTLLPRVILQMRPNEDVNLYLSFAKGVLPGDINLNYAYAAEAERQQYEAQIGGVADFTDEELLDSYELGWKQLLPDDRGQLTLALYWMDWSNQKARTRALIFEDPDGDGVVNMFPVSRAVTITGDSRLKGIELESLLRLTDRWSVEANVNWADSEYRDFLFDFIEPITGTSQQRGNQTPRYPEWSGNFTITYTAPFRTSGWEWYTRWDWIYFGETFVDEGNLATADSYSLINARVGAQRDDLTVELFVKNLLDEEAWASASRFTDFSILGNILGLGASQGIVVSPVGQQQFGLRFNYEF